jgi:hypothetical protein
VKSDPAANFFIGPYLLKKRIFANETQKESKKTVKFDLSKKTKTSFFVK